MAKLTIPIENRDSPHALRQSTEEESSELSLALALRGTACPNCRQPIALRRTGSVRLYEENWQIEVRCRKCGHTDWHIGV